ncbi:hypothetical protein H4219_002673 [Mycoemilia scoparia]|uniref:Alpha/beta hydrolase fold-3 domain-containing protein n=1 Tax=Mycoemilia scoparia TaxID=417184 RepID=A0A9W7ZWZ3_9FUNG|nr:hypothetical protein H4219_002673 [Mycoemilia scoparia]
MISYATQPSLLGKSQQPPIEDIDGFIRIQRGFSLDKLIPPNLQNTTQIYFWNFWIEGKALLESPDRHDFTLFDRLCEEDCLNSKSGFPRNYLGEIVVETAEAAKNINIAERNHQLGKDAVTAATTTTGSSKFVGAGSFSELKPIAKDEMVIVDFHGGAYMDGTPLSQRTHASKLSRISGMRVIVPDYRLAPKSIFPAQLHDAYLIWKKLMISGFKPKNIFISGDSAGAHLALSLVLLLKQIGNPMPRAPGKPLTEELTNKFADPFISPINGNFAGFPPMLVQVGGAEMMYDDVLEFAKIVSEQQREYQEELDSKEQLECTRKEPLRLEIYDDMPHVFQFLPFTTIKAEEAYENIGKWISEYKE